MCKLAIAPDACVMCIPATALPHEKVRVRCRVKVALKIWIRKCLSRKSPQNFLSSNLVHLNYQSNVLPTNASLIFVHYKCDPICSLYAYSIYKEATLPWRNQCWITLTQTLSLPAKHSDAFHCLYKYFWWIWGLSERPGEARPTLAHL